jgi:hypothetical protein
MTQNRHSRRKAAQERGLSAPVDQSTLSRLLFILLAIMALAIQILVVQTHIHIPQTLGRSASVSIVTVAQTLMTGPGAKASAQPANLPRDRYPINEDPSNCPLCQEITHSGQFVQSAAVLAYLPVWVSVHFIVFSETLSSLFTVSHNWRGRAPPQN